MYKYILYILFSLILVFSCDKKDPLEMDVTILSTHTEMQWVIDLGVYENHRVGVVEYCTKNIGTRKVNGWKVFFDVHLMNSPQIMAYEGLSYNLQPNEISKTRSVVCLIPEYYGDAYKATLKHVEIW